MTDDEINNLKNATGGINFDHANKMIENAIGTFSLPLGIATNFKINNDNDYLVPMVIEEPSVIAAASKAAKIAKTSWWIYCKC